MKIKLINDEEYLYNYTGRIPFNNGINENIFVTPKIDFVRIAINRQINKNNSLNNFFNKLNSVTVFKTQPLKQSNSGYNHSRKYVIKINEKVYETFLNECMYEAYMPYLWTIHDPDKSVIIELENMLAILDQYNLNSVEFDFDFQYKNNVELYNFLKSTVTLAWQGEALHLPYQTTHYLNNNRKAFSKTGKIYQKKVFETNGKECDVSRLEISFKYRMLKKKNIRKIIDIFRIEMNDVMRYFSFKEFNFDLFRNKLQQIGVEVTNLDELLRLFRQDIINGYLVETDATAKTYCMNKTFLKFHSFNKVFRNSLSGGSFWDGKMYSFDSSVMEE